MATHRQSLRRNLEFVSTSRKNLELYICIWLDQNIHTTEENQQNLKIFRHIINHLQVFDEISSCLDYIRSIINEKIILIVSGSLGREILPNIWNLPQLSACYIFCGSVAVNREWSRQYRKVKGVFNDIKILIDSVKEDQIIREKFEDHGSISVINGNCDSLESRHAMSMWFQLFIDVLLRMRFKSRDVEEIVKLCQDVYRTNTWEMSKIKQFEETYQSKDAIRWYTRDACFYRIINKALRTQDYDTLLAFRYLISDIANQIKCLHDDFIRTSSTKEKIRVYRGQSIETKELELLKKNVGAFVTMNSFLSTSYQESTALQFARRAYITDDTELVLFEIEIDPRLQTKAFANVRNISEFMYEEEMLLMLGAMFRIKNVSTRINSDIRTVELSLVSENDNELKDLFHHMLDEIGSEASWDSLGKILIEMGEYDQANKCYERMSYEAKLSLADAQCGLGHASWRSKKCEKTLEYHETALKVRQELLSNDHEKVAESCSFIGAAYCNEGKYDQALAYLKRAMDIQMKRGPSNSLALSKTCVRMATIYQSMNDDNEAMKYHYRTLEIQRCILPHNHPHIASSYNNIGCIYYRMKNYPDAMTYFQQCHRIRKRILPVNHPDMLAIEKNIHMVKSRIENKSLQRNYSVKTTHPY